MAHNEDIPPRATTSSSRSQPGVRSSDGRVLPCVVGTGPLGIRDVIVERLGADVLERALARLTPDEAAAYRAITPESWVPLELSTRAIDAVAAEVGRDPEPFFAEMVRLGSMRSLNSFYRTLLRFAWDEMLVARAATAYARIRNVGRLEAVLTGPGQAIAVLREWPDLTPRTARSLGYTMEAFFLAAGKRDVVVATELAPAEANGQVSGATYRCSWRS